MNFAQNKYSYINTMKHLKTTSNPKDINHLPKISTLSVFKVREYCTLIIWGHILQVEQTLTRTICSEFFQFFLKYILLFLIAPQIYRNFIESYKKR